MPGTDFSKIGKSNNRRSKAQERRVAKLLSDWTGAGFRRRRVEGRDYATIAVDLCADVIPIDGSFLFSVEAKSGRGFRVESLLAYPRTCLFTVWWHQTCYDAQLITQALERKVYPMLFFRPTPQTTWVAVSARAMPILRPVLMDGEERVLQAACWFPHLLFDEYEWMGPVVCNVAHGRSKTKKPMGLELDPVVMCAWKDFAINVDPASAIPE